MAARTDPIAGSDTGDEPPRPSDAVEVARIVGAWGVRGGIKVKPFAADPQALFSSKRWFVEPSTRVGPAAPGGTAATSLLLRIVDARSQGEHVVATARELIDRDAAERLRGARVFIARSSFPTPDDGEYYWVDLIGLSVVDRDGATLGTVDGLLETGPHCVLSVAPPAVGAAPILIPFVDAYVDRVDLVGRRIDVDWPTDDEDG